MKSLTRREFHGHLAKNALNAYLLRAMLASEIAGGGLLLEGCGLAQDIENWTPVAIAALKSIELVLSTNGFALNPAQTLAFNAAIAAITAVDNAAIAYGKITPPPTTLTQELYDALQVATQQIQAFLTALALPASSLLNLIVGLAQIIFSTILGFMNQLPPPPAGAKVFTLKNSYRVGADEFGVTAVKRGRRKFRSDWNGTLDSGAKAGVVVPSKAKFSWMSTHF